MIHLSINTTKNTIFLKKAKASALHLATSATILLFIYFTFINQWFPESLFFISGGIQGITIAVLVDIVIGPLLTFIVYNTKKSKKELTLDLGTIILIQLSALFWGIFTIHDQRPIALVFWENRFYTVPAEALRHYKNTERYNDILSRPLRAFIAKKPLSIDGINKMLERIKETDTPPHHQLELYRLINNENNIPDFIAKQTEDIVNSSPHLRKDLNRILKNKSITYGDIQLAPLRAKYGQRIAIIDRSSGRIIGYLKNS